MDTAARLKSSLLGDSARNATLASAVRLAGPALALGLGAYLRLYRLGDGGLGNPFYAAAVRSMGHSLHNFFFAAFDPLGTFSVDKPPLALWLQTLSTLIFGFEGFALVLPQAIAGIVAVALLLAVISRMYGSFAGAVAAAVLAVLPASVLVSRNNTMDTLVMALSLTTLALTLRAARNGRLLPLLLAGAAAGLAFNTKGFEAFVALPGILACFWLTSTLPWRHRARDLAAFAAIAAVVGLSWVTAVSLVPASSRPLVLNSNGNSEIDLTLGYNGFDRVLGGDGFNPANALTTTSPNMIPAGVFYGGERGPLRIFGRFPGELVAVAIPIAMAGAVLILLDLRDRRKRGASALWLLWLSAGLVAFSASRLGSPHYLEAFSPALAACFAAACQKAIVGSLIERLIALAGVAGSGVYGLERLTQLGGAGDEIRLLAIVALLLSAVLAFVPFSRRFEFAAAASFAPFACIIAVLFAMSFQAVHDAPIEGVQPGAVLMTEDRSRAVRYDPASPSYSFITGNYDYLSTPLNYLQARLQPGQYLAGVRSFYMASAVISQRDLPVLPLYSEFRNRPELPIAELRRLVDEHKVEYFLVSLPVLRSLYPEAADLVQARCHTDVSRLAGLVPQTGLQLLRCG